MRFLANENFPGTAVKALEMAGNDIVWVRAAAPGCSDQEVLAWAAREERILLTFDKDFGELARALATAGRVWCCLAARAHATTGRGRRAACQFDSGA
jgi:predicted nuclease of predicted toxin-antitoxin system